MADTLLTSGTPPADLATAMRRAPLGLPSAPSYAAGLTLCDQGVVLGNGNGNGNGNGTVIADLADLPGERTGLAVEGRETRILALLSIARNGLAPPHAIRQFASASRALARGEVSLAAITLCHIGQPPLAHSGVAKSLDLAATLMDQGLLPYDMLKGVGLLPEEAGKGTWETYRDDQSQSLRKENDNHYPANSPDGHGGEFAPKNGGGGSAEAEPKNQQLADAGADAHSRVVLITTYDYGIE